MAGCCGCFLLEFDEDQTPVSHKVPAQKLVNTLPKKKKKSEEILMLRKLAT